MFVRIFMLTFQNASTVKRLSFVAGWWLLFLFSISGAEPEQAPIRVGFHLDKPQKVTLVIEDDKGNRVRNLVSDTLFPAGENEVWWDGLDESGRIKEWQHGIYEVQGKLVNSGTYRVRGLSHEELELRYEFAIYNPGNPPWATADSHGGWLGNHAPPCSVLFVPSKKQILVGSSLTENDHGLAWLDLRGNKIRGQTWVGGIWTGPACLARDVGPRPIPGVYAYAASVWENELRLNVFLEKKDGPTPPDPRFGSGEDHPILEPTFKFPASSYQVPPSVSVVELFWDPRTRPTARGLAVWNGILGCSLSTGELFWVDVLKRSIMGRIKVPDPRGLAFDSKGNLLVLSGKQLLLIPMKADGKLDSKSSPLISSELEDPQCIALDRSGKIYISDHGQSHQVKIFQSTGKLLGTIGKAGPPSAGTYDPNHMNHPKGITLFEENGSESLWVAEEDFQPKRVSVWSLDGKLLDAFYGPSIYGGGGYFDPQDSSRFYHNGMEFNVDWKTGKNKPVSIYYRPDSIAYMIPTWKAAPETPIRVRDELYLVNAFSGMATNGPLILGMWQMRNDVAHLIGAAGVANGLDIFSKAYLKGAEIPGVQEILKSKQLVSFIWSDLNRNGMIEASEIQYRPGASWGGVTVDSKLAFTLPDSTRIEVLKFTKDGIPVYDFSNKKKRFTPSFWQENTGGGQILDLADNWSVAIAGPIQGFQNGEEKWTYPNQWPSLHASHYAPLPNTPGCIIGATRLLGPPIKINKHQLWGINGNMGNVYLLTSDGLFVSTLFKDMRISSPWPAEAQRNMSVDNFSMKDESFFNTWSQTADGNVYIQNQNRIVRVNGLNTLQRLPDAKITITRELLAQCQEHFIKREAARMSKKDTENLEVLYHTRAPKVDGDLKDWDHATWIDIDSKTKASIAVTKDKLYVAYKTGHANLLENKGDSVPLLFKSGGALDLMIETNSKANAQKKEPAAGDQRLLVSVVGGKPIAIHYQAVVPGSTDPISFSGPTRTVVFDRVDNVSQHLELASGKTPILEVHEGNVFGNKVDQYTGTSYEYSIPLSVLHWSPTPESKFRGDVGILIGNGFQSVQRVYWHNKATGLISDVPSEAMLTPQLWGTWFIKEKSK
jgi:hypothetical protein